MVILQYSIGTQGRDGICNDILPDSFEGNKLLHHCIFSTASRLVSTILLSNIIFWHHWEGIKHVFFSQTNVA